jgi:hypothetical protein
VLGRPNRFFITPNRHQTLSPSFPDAVLAARHPASAASGRFHYIEYPLDCQWVEDDKKRAAVAGQLQGIWMIIEALAERADALLSHGPTMDALRTLRGDGGGDGASSGGGGIDLMVVGEWAVCFGVSAGRIDW